ncbi:NAD(P)/FAD-dependent oxidoreductase [Salinactinospora qingdaonensis]|uniref:FAD-binding oxidoreductase n=1 Tax=Salinactinospora qingdaonensis TaxID=702744 RepID=A0ABP7FFN3_9ACTN
MKVIVVGGGIVGVSAAYRLTQRGVATTLVDRADLGQATGAGAGVIFPWPFPDASPQARSFCLAAAAHYPTLMAEITEEGGPPTGYEQVGGAAVADDPATVDAEYRMLSELAGRPGYEGLGPVSRLGPGEPAVRFPALREDYAATWCAGMVRLDGDQTRAALLYAAEERGLRRRAGDAELIVERDRVSGVRVGGDELRADAIIVAAGAWSAGLLRPFGVELPLSPMRGQLVHFSLPDQRTGAWPIVRVSDRACYLLAFPPNRVVVGSTFEPDAGFDRRVTAAGVRHVLSLALETAPGLAEATVAQTRVGFRPASADGEQLLGPLPALPGAIVATGLGSQGLTFGPYQGAVAARLALGEDPELDLTPFRPDRAVATP